MINFVTLHPECPNYGLVKDVGQIPYRMSLNGGVEAYLVSAQIDVYGEHVDETKGLNIVKIKPVFGNDTLAGFIYLLKNSKQIDVLNLYHCRWRTYLYAKLYKFLNHKGKVYLKLDAGLTTIDKLNSDRMYKNLLIKSVRLIDFTSAESKVIVDELQEITGEKVYNIPNGTDLEGVGISMQKENIFLTVARIGAPEKNDEVLLEAFSRISDKCDWNLELVGNIEDGFSSFISDFFSYHPNLKERVIFCGEITNRNELIEHYDKAKIFVLPSKYEGFPLACTEAMSRGCYMVLSDQVTPIKEFTNEGKYGVVAIVDDIDDLAHKMLVAIDIVNKSSQLTKEISNYACLNYSWKTICEQLEEIVYA